MILGELKIIIAERVRVEAAINVAGESQRRLLGAGDASAGFEGLKALVIQIDELVGNPHEFFDVRASEFFRDGGDFTDVL